MLYEFSTNLWLGKLCSSKTFLVLSGITFHFNFLAHMFSLLQRINFSLQLFLSASPCGYRPNIEYYICVCRLKVLQLKPTKMSRIWSIHGDCFVCYRPLGVMIQQLGPLFKMDYYLPRSITACLMLHELQEVFRETIFPVEVCCATLHYWIKTTQNKKTYFWQNDNKSTDEVIFIPTTCCCEGYIVVFVSICLSVRLSVYPTVRLSGFSLWAYNFQWIVWISGKLTQMIAFMMQYVAFVIDGNEVK